MLQNHSPPPLPTHAAPTGGWSGRWQHQKRRPPSPNRDRADIPTEAAPAAPLPVRAAPTILAKNEEMRRKLTIGALELRSISLWYANTAICCCCLSIVCRKKVVVAPGRCTVHEIHYRLSRLHHRKGSNCERSPSFDKLHTNGLPAVAGDLGVRRTHTRTHAGGH